MAPGASAAPPTPYDHVLTVGFAPSASAASRATVRRDVGVTARNALAAPGLQQVTVPNGQSLSATAASLRAFNNVDFVELPGSYTTNAITNDPYVVNKNVWALNNDGSPFALTPDGQPVSGTSGADIGAFAAWDVPAAGHEPIAIVDTGVAWQHQDLAANIWTNSGETGLDPFGQDKRYNGIDDDGNGYVDDYHGWDFIGDLNGTTRNPPDNNPSDPSSGIAQGHGTHVSGIAGAVGNNFKGIAGVNPGAKIMPLRAADEAGQLSFGAIENAFSYAIDKGVRVINGSFSGSSASPGMSTIISANPQVLFVFAAGNNAINHDASSGLDHWFPCDLTEPNIICVAATDWNDQLANFSSPTCPLCGSDYGYDSVDLAAPGKGILSTVPTSPSDPAAGGDLGYAFKDGTSMASPQVAGAVSLIWSADPALDSSQVKSLIVDSVDPLPSLSGKVGFGGRLDLNAAMHAVANPPPPRWPVTPAPPTTGSSGTTPVTPPSDPSPPPTILDTRPPDLRVVSAHTVRVGVSGRLRFDVTCGERCTIAATARPNVRGLRRVTTRSSAEAGKTRTVAVSFRGAELRSLHRALSARGRVGVFITVVVTDTVGNQAPPRSFRISLIR